ncbi:MAG: efflux RND transporter permease subunit, partial [Sphingobacteriales bacterium]
WARQQISERLQEARNQIPEGVGSPELSPITTGLGEVYQYLVLPKPGYEDKFTPTELRTIQDWIVRRQLLGTPGIADVSSFGGFLKQYEVAIDPDRLKSLGVTIPEVTKALEQNNQNTGGSYIKSGPRAYFIRTEGLVNSAEEIGKIVVRTDQSGIPLLIRDVADVQIGHAARYGALTYNDQGEAVGGIVMMLKGANSNEVIERVKERMKTIQTSLPEGVEVHAYLDRSELVGRAIDTVTRNLVEGALIVIFVLVLFLGNLRAGLVVASVIPLSMLFAIGLMVAFGVSGNLMSLGAIDFGLVVDGAVIIVEAILHRFALGNSQNLQTSEQRDGAVFEAASKIRQSAAFGEIIILIVYLPILALVGIEGKMFRPMAQTVTFAILGAFILSLTYVPAMSALVLRPQKAHKPNISDRMIAFLHRLYEPALQFALRAKLLVVGAAMLLLIISGVVFSRMGGEFIPTLDEGDFAVETRVLLGSSIDHTVEQSLKSAKVLLHQFPEVKEVVGKIGSAEIPTDPMPVEAIDMMVILKGRDEWTSASTREELANKMTEALEVLPGVTFSFLQPIQMRFNELMSGAKQDVVMKIYGEDLDRLSQYAAKAGSLVRNIEGAEDVYIEEVQGLPQIVVQYDRNRLAQFGLNVEELNQVVQAAFAGQSAGLVYEQERRFDLVVRMKQEFRNDIESVRNLLVPTPYGHQVPLQQVADIKLLPGINQIQRDDAKRRIMVAFNVRGRDVESVVEELREKASSIEMAPGYYYTFGGQFENLEQAKARLQIAVPAALLLIFILLYFTFHSIWQALLIFTAVPLSAIGGVLALWLRGMPFSISAGVGFIALFGVAVLNGIVLIGYFNQLKAEGVTDIKTRILQGTAVRLRPVLMTATVASLGFLPMALSNTAGAEVQKPLATVVIGGLVSATFLTLFVLPILYSWLERWRGSTLAKRALGILLLFAAPNAFAQQPAPAPTLSLSQALEQAEKNPAIRAGSLEFDAATAQRKAALGLCRGAPHARQPARLYPGQAAQS